MSSDEDGSRAVTSSSVDGRRDEGCDDEDDRVREQAAGKVLGRGDSTTVDDEEETQETDDDDVRSTTSESSSSSSSSESLSSSSEGYGFGRESSEMLALMERLAAQRLGVSSSELSEATIEPVLGSFDLKGVAEYIKSGRAKNVVVMTGAGISVSAGIPDFRSESGLYSRLGEYDLPYPQAIFELSYFREKPEPFYKLSSDLFPGKYAPTPTHHFIKLLHDRSVLRRCFTQNIDSLECATGLPVDKVVAAHGNFDTAHCLNGHEVDTDVVEKACRAGIPMRCARCGEYVKPDIVFFGENLPERFYDCAQEDFQHCDLLIVIGTSLVVHPFAGLIERPKEHVPRLLINLERAGEAPNSEITRLYRLAGLGRGTGFNFDEETNYRDALHLGKCDEAVVELSELLGWRSDLENLIANCPIRNGRNL
jgi:NAD-dependent deacetylase sirtuin 2